MELKAFQRAALDTLKAFLECARTTGNPEEAFKRTFRADHPEMPLPSYRTLPGLPGVPNVCLRLPTGGGKTLLAAHTVAVAGRAYMEREFPVVFWLVPTNTIRKQTAEALKKPSHPYRAAIDAAFGDRVGVFDMSEITQIRPQDLTHRVCVVVSTIQSLRVSNTEGRKAYAHSESFEPHFTRVPGNVPGLDRFEDGGIKFSFVNLMAVHRPLIIVDEAHKAGTKLSFDMLAALRPSCIVEFTATPDTDSKNGSNVLFRASAAEVKAAEMIKLPIVLTEHPDWRAAVHDAVETRARLAETARNDPRHIRPLTLFQAQDKGQEVTVEVLKQHLMENENIPADRIVVATGEQRELDAVNLFDPACSVEHIITVEALKEGWDCSFAYVLCSVANVGSMTDIEQLLGRVLRMPYAQTRPHEALNRAYAHVSSPRFGDGARLLSDTLIQKMGFQPDEAADAVVPVQKRIPGFEDPGGPRPAPVLSHTLDAKPDLSGLDAEVAEQVKTTLQPDGTFTVTVTGNIPEALEHRLTEAAATPERREAVKNAVKNHRLAVLSRLSPAERGETLAVPTLCLYVQGELEFVEKELLLDLGGWDLGDYPAELTPEEFAVRETAERWEVDLEGEKVVYSHLDQSVQLELGLLNTSWNELELSRWLDRECRCADITQPVMLEFCRKAVQSLTENRGVTLNALLRFKYQLAKAIRGKIEAHRQQAYTSGYQTCLFGSKAEVETSFVFGFTFERKRPYLPAWSYAGSYRFGKHFFAKVGELADKGEEFDCAQTLDTLPEVKHWVRNLAGPGHANESFWLPTSTDRFYPDFVAELNDGRVFVVEYKGAHLADTQDTKEKRNIGELWAEKSGGKGIFLMAEKKNAQGLGLWEQMRAAMENKG